MHLEFYPSKMLRKICRPISELTKKRKNKIKEMLILMKRFGGIGIAAPQLGWNARIFVMNVTRKLDDDMVFINPEIVETSGDIITYPEGCLSIPGAIGLVERQRNVIIKALDLNGKEFVLSDDSLLARCALHELDHLNGILMIDKAKRIMSCNGID